MADMDVQDSKLTLDTSDVDQWVGKPVIFAEMWDACNATDIRRWVQAMDYPNPIHWDENFARARASAGSSRRRASPWRWTMAMAATPPASARCRAPT